MDYEEQSTLELMQRHRRDRRMLLKYILSGNLIKKVVMPPGAVSLDDVDLDLVSVDYVLNCAKKGQMLELSEAIRTYYDSLEFPTVLNDGSIEDYFLVTKPENSGLPPARPPPPIPVLESSSIETSLSKSHFLHSSHQQELSVDDIDDIDDLEDEDEEIILRHHSNETSDLLLGLPSFATGISDDDLRETAYEIVVACAGATGGLIVPSREIKKEKKSKLMRKLVRSKNDNVVSQPRLSGMVGLLDTMKTQLEISDAMDIRTRQGLLNALIGREGKRMDAFLVPLELLCCVSRAEFSDKKTYFRWQKRQLNMLEEGLIHHPVVGFGESGHKTNDLKNILRKIEESESLPASTGEIQRMECLRSLREITTVLSERPARGDLAGEICHWADGYHLNVRLYERMLISVFDILEEGKLIEEAEEILEFLKSTWRILGVTETIHDTCYAWVLFKQFVSTGDIGLLKVATEQLRKIPLKEQRGPQERMHLKSLRCFVEVEDGFKELTFLQSFLSPIQKWIDKRLGDYHSFFSEASGTLKDILTGAMIVHKLLLGESEQVMQSAPGSDRDLIEAYVSSSIRISFSRVLHYVEAKTDSSHEHVLTCLAEETKKLLKTDSTIFMPIFSKWHQLAPVVSASLLHKLYGNKLRPFLDRSEHLTEDVVSVFPEAASLERYIMTVISLACEEEIVKDNCLKKLISFEVEKKSGTLVLRWLNAKLGRILEWVERAIQQESWNSISPQQRHGISIVEVYRIIEEVHALL